MTQLVAIRPAECPQREKAIDAGHACVRLERLILNDIVEAIHAQHVAWFREKQRRVGVIIATQFGPTGDQYADMGAVLAAMCPPGWRFSSCFGS